mgnify:CR=1 FL=1
MQEEVNQKVISLSIQGVKITASVLKAALRKFLEMDKWQPQETESNAGENGRKDRTGSGERKGTSPKKD